MNGLYLAAALLALAAALIHGIGGHLTNLKRLKTSAVPPSEKLEIQASWHLVTVTLAATAALLTWHALDPVAPWLGLGLLGLFGLFGLVFFAYALHAGSLWRTPQWALLWSIALLIALA